MQHSRAPVICTGFPTVSLALFIIRSVVPHFKIPVIIALCTNPLQVLKILTPSLPSNLTSVYHCVSITSIAITQKEHIGMFCFC